MSILYTIAPNLDRLGGELFKCFGQTLKMLAVSGSISFFLGLFFGVVLIITRKGGILQNLLKVAGHIDTLQLHILQIAAQSFGDHIANNFKIHNT